MLSSDRQICQVRTRFGPQVGAKLMIERKEGRLRGMGSLRQRGERMTCEQDFEVIKCAPPPPYL